MRTNSTYRQNYHGGSISDGSASTATPQLRKLASLEFGTSTSLSANGSTSTRNVNGNPIIDLTHVTDFEELGSHQRQKYIVTVHDETGNGTVSRPSARTTTTRHRHSTERNSSKHSQYSASSGRQPDYLKIHQDVMVMSSSRATFHQSGAYSSKKDSSQQRTVRINDPSPAAAVGKVGGIKEFKTVHHNGANIFQAGDGRATQYVLAQPKQVERQPQKVHHQPQTVEVLAKLPRSNAIQKKTLWGSLFQCVSPPVPGDPEMPIQYRSAQVAMQALRSDEDALDRVFNSVERFSCRDDVDLHRELRELEQRDGSSMNSMMAEATVNRGKKKMSSRNDDKDALDTVFDGVERFACRDGANTAEFNYVKTGEKDVIDRVFEGFESFACHDDDFAAASLQSRATRMLKRPDPSATKAIRGRPNELEKMDMLERFGKRFERAVCTSQAAHVGYEGDVLDEVFERLERTTCRDEQFRESGGGYYDTSVYDLDMQNSLIASNSLADGSKEWCDDIPRNNSFRRPSCGNGQPPRNERNLTPPSRDMLDYVFENVEAGVCHSEENLPSRARPRNSLDRISDSRQYY